MNTYDLHTHTEWSFDCVTSLESYRRSVVARGLAGVSVTDHDTIDGALALRDTDPPFDVIVGCEFTLDDGSHLIGLFLETPIGATSLFKTADAIHDQGGLVVMPHPFRSHTGLLSQQQSASAVSQIMGHVDAIEVFNAKSRFRENQLAMELALRWNKPVTAGSDAHRVSRIGRGHVGVKSLLTPQALLNDEHRVIGIDQQDRKVQQTLARREGIRRLALRFKSSVPAAIWRRGKTLWENACETWEDPEEVSYTDYGVFQGARETTDEPVTHGVRQ